MTLWLEHLRGGQVRYRDADGVRTRSVEAGPPEKTDTSGREEPAVVLLHGTWGHAEAYIRNVVGIATAGYRVYAIDMLGHGFTERRDSDSYRIRDYVAHLFGFLDAIGAPAAHVVGESLGGWVAMRAAMDAPDRVLSVVNVVGGGLRPVPPTREEERGWATLEERSKRIIDDPSFANWRRRMEWLVHDPRQMTDELVRVRAEINASKRNRTASAAVYTMVARMLRGQEPGTLSAADIARIDVPVCYLWTDHNPTTPASVARAAHEITHVSQFHLMTGCAHWPQFEKAEEFNRIVTEYLDARDDQP